MTIFNLYKYISFIELFLFMIFCFLVDSHEKYMYILFAITIVNFMIMCCIWVWQDINELVEEKEKKMIIREELDFIDECS